MAGNVTVTLDAATAGFVASMVKAAGKLREVEDGVKRVGQAGNQASQGLAQTGKAGAGAGGGLSIFQQAAGGLANTLGRLIGPGAALGAFVGMLRAEQSAAQEAATALLTVVDAKAQLLQGVKGPAEGQREILLAERAALASGMGIGATAELLDQFRDLKGGNEQDFIDLARSQLFAPKGGPARFTEAVAGFRAGYGEQVGSARQMVSAFIASGGTDEAPVAALKTLGEMRAIGAGPEELLAAVTALTPSMGGAGPAAAAVRRLAQQVGKQGYGGGGLMAGLEAWQQRDPEALRKVIIGAAGEGAGAELGGGKDLEDVLSGNVRVRAAYELLTRERGSIQEATQRIGFARASGKDYETALQTAAAVPEVGIPQRRRIAAIALELARQEEGIRELEYQTSKDLQDTATYLQPDPFSFKNRVGRWIIDPSVRGMTRFIGGARVGRDQARRVAAARIAAEVGLDRELVREEGPAGYGRAMNDPTIQEAIIGQYTRSRLPRGAGPLPVAAPGGELQDVLRRIEQNTRLMEANTRRTPHRALRDVRADDGE